MFGQILIGFAQPFVLSAPSYYSDLWFTSRGRISATALASLSNPVGAALGQLIDPMIATKPDRLPEMVLWVAVIATIACLPWWFVQAKPPSPPCASAATEKLRLRVAVRVVFKNRDFIIVLVLVSTTVKTRETKEKPKKKLTRSLPVFSLPRLLQRHVLPPKPSKPQHPPFPFPTLTHHR